MGVGNVHFCAVGGVPMNPFAFLLGFACVALFSLGYVAGHLTGLAV